MTNSKPIVPPLWTNPRITLYHGTVEAAARSIVTRVDLSHGAPKRDFGRGLYTTTWRYQAQDWANQTARRRGGRPAVVRITLDRDALGFLSTLAFVRGARGAQDFWKIVRHCRSGLAHRSSSPAYYDVVYGPVAVLWENPMLCYTIANYDQISFHSVAAESILNDKAICSKEIDG
jgi:hypothetical protein